MSRPSLMMLRCYRNSQDRVDSESVESVQVDFGHPGSWAWARPPAGGAPGPHRVVDGSYQYAPDLETAYPHTRPIKWKVAVPRTRFTQGALYEIGLAMSFFQVRNYADEFRAVLDGSPASVTPEPEQDETVGIVPEDIEELTRDFVLKRLSQELKGHPLTHLVAHLLNLMGYRTRVSPEGPNGGFDIIAYRDELGFEPQGGPHVAHGADAHLEGAQEGRPADGTHARDVVQLRAPGDLAP